MTFRVSGEGRILGVGNGDPSSHEPDQFLDQWSVVRPAWKRATIAPALQAEAVSANYDDSEWSAAASSRSISEEGLRSERAARVSILRGSFNRPNLAESSDAQLLVRGLPDAVVYLNGARCELTPGGCQECAAILSPAALHDGKNVIAIVCEETRRPGEQGDLHDPAIVKVRTPPTAWKRSLFNGLAQVIVKSNSKNGAFELIAETPGLQQAVAAY